MRSMARLNSARNARTGYLKYLTIDLPFSRDSFNYFFQQYSTHKKNNQSDSCKVVLSINELRQTLGNDCLISVQKHTTTRQRLIGDVTLHHRPKRFTPYDNTDCNR